MSDYPAQVKFAFAFARWLLAAEARGFEITFGDGFRDPKIKFYYSTTGDKSFHCRRLAHDVNLFYNGVYLTTKKQWDESGLGQLWLTMGGTWGGTWPGKKCDPNHLSWGEE